MIYWTAKNNNSYLAGTRSAATMRAAVRDARRYVAGELYGEGEITYIDAAGDVIRTDERSIFTRYQWVTRV